MGYRQYRGVKDLFEKQGRKCFYCKDSMEEHNFTVDHFLPKSEGFTIRNNIVICCKKCNQAKGNYFPTDEQCWEYVQFNLVVLKRTLDPFWEEFYNERKKLHSIFSLLGF
jgi:5-methylcytosine-specific restriction endonuclease McrA